VFSNQNNSYNDWKDGSVLKGGHYSLISFTVIHLLPSARKGGKGSVFNLYKRNVKEILG